MKMKEKQYWIFYKVDAEKMLFTVFVCDKEKKEVCKYIFSRDDIVETYTDNSFLEYLLNKDQYKISFYEKKMTAEERHRIHKIFPYIPQFTNLDEFSFWYNRINSGFHYSEYIDAKILAYKMLFSSEYETDGKWNCIEEKGIHYLYCKWKDKVNISHMVLLDDKYFISDLTYQQIYRKEKRMEISFEISEIQPFIKERPDSMLDIYLNGGGKKIFSFLTAKIMNHPVELLGKAGLSKLADNIHKYRDIHMKGKTLPEIFRLPLAVLKSANKGEDLMLYELEDRKLLAKAFEENRAVFSEPMSIIGELWIRYYYLNAQTYYGIKKKGNLFPTLKYLNQCCSNENEAYTVFGLYQNYLAYAQRIGGNYIHGLYPKNLLSAVEESVAILQMRYENEKLLQFKKFVQSSEYQFLEDDLPTCPYRIRVPETPEDMYIAAEELQFEALKRYRKNVRTQNVMVAFIEDKEKGNQIIGAIAVYSKTIEKVWGCCFQELSQEVREYLQDYAKRKKLFYYVSIKNKKEECSIEKSYKEQEIREDYQKLTKLLIEKGLFITTMESATSGQIASLITDTEGSSAIMKGAFVTYSNEAKIQMGVSEEIIRTYTVYSKETAQAMAEACRKAYDADIGIGVTGTMGNIDPANLETSVPGEVYFAIDLNGEVMHYYRELPVQPTRLAYKLAVAKEVADELMKLLEDLS